jgi:hypothetical protein
MPVAKVLDLRVVALYAPEDIFLISAILVEAHRRATGVWSGFDYAPDFYSQPASMLAKRADKAAASLISLELIALVENRG